MSFRVGDKEEAYLVDVRYGYVELNPWTRLDSDGNYTLGCTVTERNKDGNITSTKEVINGRLVYE